VPGCVLLENTALPCMRIHGVVSMIIEEAPLEQRGLDESYGNNHQSRNMSDNSQLRRGLDLSKWFMPHYLRQNVTARR
jgi:hypothetical protein